MNDRSPLKTDNYSNKRKAEDRPQSSMNSQSEDRPAEGSVSAKRGRKISQEELTEIINQIDRMSITVGRKCYMIPIDWWKIVLEANEKGHINDVPQIITTSLFDGESLKRNLTANKDYCLATEDVMSRLSEAFGVQLGHEIPVHQSGSHKHGKSSSEDGNIHSNMMTQDELTTLIRITEEEKLTLGAKWFIVSKHWWNVVHQAHKTGFPDDIGAINCEEVSQRDGHGWILKSGLVESSDYVYLPKKVFVRFHDVFGLENADRDYIERQVVRKGKSLILQTYPRTVEVSLARDRKICVTIRLTGDETMSELRQTVLEKINLTETSLENLRFYVTSVEGEEHWEEIDPSQENLDVYFDTAQKVTIDIKDEEGNWFFGSKTAVLTSPVGSTRSTNVTSMSSTAYNVHSPRKTRIGDASGSYGTCGLTNLGNTCFMASAIQCLSNVPPLTDYFLRGDFIKHINRVNPLGTGGELAQAYAELIEQVWQNEHTAVAPRKLKGTIGQFAPRFSGYQQQDSQELLAYLLDGLHEDLNRIQKKPYIQEEEDANKLEEHAAAKAAWQTYKSRNDSIIVDTFHGQLKSRLVCPDCHKVSIKFDPFCFLSVPVPAGRNVPKLSLTLIYNSIPKKKWAKFTMGLTTSMCTVKDVIACVNDNLKQANTSVECCLFTVGVASDNVRIMNSSDYVIGDHLPNAYFVAQVDHSESERKYLIVKNHSREGRSLTVPMIYSYLNITDITPEFVKNRVIAFTQTTYHNDRLERIEDSYDVFVDTGDKHHQFPLHLDELPDGKHVTLVVTWKDPTIFNNYKGEHLIEREVSVQKTRDVHLLDCIDLFTREEQLGEQDSWYCPVCKDHKRATKKLDLWSLPEILIIHLKRFHYGRFNREKIEDPVLIPVRDFELNDKLANDKHDHVKYDLIACSNHSGGLGGGHYTASAKSINGKWYEFNDSWVNCIPTPPNPWLDRNSYVLVYQRKPLDAAFTDHNLQMETE